MNTNFEKLARGFGLFKNDEDYENPYIRKHFIQMDMAAVDSNTYAVWYHWCKIATHDKYRASFARDGFVDIVRTIIKAIDADDGIDTFIESPDGRTVLNRATHRNLNYDIAIMA